MWSWWLGSEPGPRTAANHYRESAPTLNLIEPPWSGPVWWCGGWRREVSPIPLHPQTIFPSEKFSCRANRSQIIPIGPTPCSVRKSILPQLLRLAGASNDFADRGRRESALRHLSRAGKLLGAWCPSKHKSGAERMTHAVTGEQTPPYSEQIACGNV
jgi:hypothetical protein